MITSHSNPTIKRFRALAARKNRRRQQAFAVEGLQPVWRALTSPWPVETLIISPELLTNDAAWEMAQRVSDDGTDVVEVTSEVFRHLSGRDGPTGLAAIMTGTVAGLPDFRPPPGRPIVALYEAGNPGNIGTVIRSIDAAGGGGVLLVGHCADPLGPAAIKASMGSIFSLPTAEVADADELLAWTTSYPRRIVAVTGHTDRQLWTTDLDSDAVLLFGAEGPGLPDDIAARCHTQVAIPMEGTAESLNLAAAATITVFDLKRRRDVGKADQPR